MTQRIGDHRPHFSRPAHTARNAPPLPSPALPTSPYEPPRLTFYGELGALIRGASWKGVDSVGELDPNNSFPA